MALADRVLLVAWTFGFCPVGVFLLLPVLATGPGFADLRAAGTETGELPAIGLALTVATTVFVVSAMVVALHNLFEPGRAWWVRIAGQGGGDSRNRPARGLDQPKPPDLS